jgi:hypothetical protein
MPSPALARPVKPANFPPLATVEDACAYMLTLPEAVAMLTNWQHAARLCVAARERPTPRIIAEFTDQLELALTLSWRLDLSAHPKRPPAPSIRAASRPARRRADRR